MSNTSVLQDKSLVAFALSFIILAEAVTRKRGKPKGKRCRCRCEHRTRTGTLFMYIYMHMCEI